MECTSEQFFREYFQELEVRGIPAVILHSYEKLPDEIPSDIDYAVPDKDLHRISHVLASVASRHGWVLAQTLQHEIFGFYSVVIDPENPSHFLKLDACSHYVRNRRFLISDSVLLKGSAPYRDFRIPSASSEFIYVLAKLLAKNKEPADLIPRLKELYLRDHEGAEKLFSQLLGETGQSAAEWLDIPSGKWGELVQIMRGRNRYGPLQLLQESHRLVRRILRPTGLQVALLGPDGTGKSTLMEALEVLLEPCFRNQKTFHFRPMVFETSPRGVVTDPHGKPPRSFPASFLKLIYYYVDNLLGFLTLVLPAKLRSTLVVFDRTFDDMLVDARRYRLQSVGLIVRFLRIFLPHADLTFILEGTPETIHRRKPELSIEELGRQVKALRIVSAKIPRCIFVSVDQEADLVACRVAAGIIRCLGARNGRRNKIYPLTAP